jgi:hypothetical protein
LPAACQPNLPEHMGDGEVWYPTANNILFVRNTGRLFLHRTVAFDTDCRELIPDQPRVALMRVEPLQADGTFGPSGFLLDIRLTSASDFTPVMATEAEDGESGPPAEQFFPLLGIVYDHNDENCYLGPEEFAEQAERLATTVDAAVQALRDRQKEEVERAAAELQAERMAELTAVVEAVVAAMRAEQ